MAYDNSSLTGDEICDYYYDIENNFMNPPSPTGFFIYKVIGGAFDRLNDLVTQFRIDYSILDCNVGNVEIVKSFPEEPDTNHTYYVSTVDGLTKYSYNGSEWVSEIVTGDVLNSLDVFWGRSYNLLRPILYEGSHREYLFEDACTSNNNKSNGYSLVNGSYHFENDCLVIESEPQALFEDKGTTASHNDHWYINSSGTATVQSDGTKLLNTSGDANFVMRNIIPSNKTITSANAYSYNPPYIVEFDIVETDGTSSSDAQVQIYSQQSTGNFSQDVTTGHYKIEVKEDEQKIWLDDTLIKTTNLSLPNARITLRARNGKYLVYKNFIVYDIYRANLRLDGSNVYNVPYEVSFDLVNDGNDNFRCHFHNSSFSNSAISSGSLWTNPSGQTTKIRFVVSEDGITRYINNTPTTLNLNQDVASTVGVRFGYWQPTQSSIKIRNYKVYRGDEKERPLTDEEYKIYLYLKNHQLLTMKDLLVAFTNAFGSAEVTTTLLNSIHTVDHKKYDDPQFSNVTLAAYDEEDTDIITDTLVDKAGVNVVNDRLAQGTLSIQIPDEGWDEEFLSLLESFISIKGNILISQGG